VDVAVLRLPLRLCPGLGIGLGIGPHRRLYLRLHAEKLSQAPTPVTGEERCSNRAVFEPGPIQSGPYSKRALFGWVTRASTGSVDEMTARATSSPMPMAT
jgi:hypothetical protein